MTKKKREKENFHFFGSLIWRTTFFGVYDSTGPSMRPNNILIIFYHLICPGEFVCDNCTRVGRTAVAKRPIPKAEM